LLGADWAAQREHSGSGDSEAERSKAMDVQQYTRQNFIMMGVKPFTQENHVAAIRQQMEATAIVEKTYGRGRLTLGLHVPDEDMPFQQKNGGTRRTPMMVAFVSPAGNPIQALPAVHILCLSHLEQFVWPLFTSVKRAYDFLAVLQEHGFLVPSHKIITFPWQQPNSESRQQKTGIVVNPLPEVFLAGIIPLHDEEKNEIYMILPVD
jgi:hypothetical protein